MKGLSARCGFALISLCLLVLAACGQASPTVTLTGGSSGTSTGAADQTPTLIPLKATLIAQATETAAAIPTNTPQPISPPCQSSQLAARLGIAGVGAGNVLGAVLIRNISSAPCSVQGTVTLTALDAQGQAIAGIAMVHPTTLPYATLPPDTPATPPSGSSASGAYVMVRMMGEYRDDTNGPCSAANEVVPAKFAVTIGASAWSQPTTTPPAVRWRRWRAATVTSLVLAPRFHSDKREDDEREGAKTRSPALSGDLLYRALAGSRSRYCTSRFA